MRAVSGCPAGLLASAARRPPSARQPGCGNVSAEAVGYVWKESPYIGAQLLVHLAIADVVNDVHGNEFWMSTAALARKARVSRATVSRSLTHMAEHGYLEVLEAGKSDRKPTRYRFVQLSTGPPPDMPHGEASNGEHASPARVNMPHGEAGNSSNTTQSNTASFSTTHPPDCVRCRGTGRIWNGTGGFETDCVGV